VSAGDTELPPPVPAATVILVRDGDDGMETLLLRREERGAFAGMWVFPGGRVDPGDADPEALQDELAAARRAAVREAFEEAALKLDAGQLVPFAHWMPPPIAPKRFSTWFFIARTPRDRPVVDGVEVLEHAWLSPAAALERQAQGSLVLAPPTWVTLHQLQAFERSIDALEAAVGRTVERFTTRPIQVDGATVLTWHGDAAYESGVDAPGARHRLWMAPGGWRYERDP
jgi:8-oxo-dGTP pyrophosphatase MutT (NUDIX family)